MARGGDMKTREYRHVSESAFQETVVRVMTVMGWRHYHTHDSRRSSRGFPDLVAVRAPRVIFAELKAQDGRVSGDQAGWMAALGHCPGVEAYVWRPGDWDEIIRILGRPRLDEAARRLSE